MRDSKKMIKVFSLFVFKRRGDSKRTKCIDGDYLIIQFK